MVNIIDVADALKDIAIISSSGFFSFVLFCSRKKIKKDYQLIMGNYLPQESDISKIEVPKCMTTEISDVDIEKLSENKFYEDIKSFNNFLENNFSEKTLQNYYKNISNIEVAKPNKFKGKRMKLDNTVGQYSILNNKISLINESAVYHELFHMASTNSDNYSTGFRYGRIGRAINEGYTELMNHRYFHDEYDDFAYHDQVILAFFLESIIGQEKMEELYLTSNLKGLIDELKKYNTLEEIEQLFSNSDYILTIQNASNNEIISKLQTKSVKNKLDKKCKKVSEEINDFLLTSMENKLLLDKETDSYKRDMIENLRSMDNSLPENDNRLNKALITKIRSIVTGMDIYIEHDHVLGRIIKAIGSDNLYDCYYDNGFQSLSHEMKKYLTDEEFNDLIETYENLHNSDNLSEMIGLREEIRKITLFYRIRSNIENCYSKKFIINLISSYIEGSDITINSNNDNIQIANYCLVDDINNILTDISENFKDNILVLKPVKMIRNRVQKLGDLTIDVDYLYCYDIEEYISGETTTSKSEFNKAFKCRREWYI
ncbi:MAG: hypothetical protein IJI58_01145 [Bacilli bacterium]|nr:hypothetical protein [Bacilli bacterium]